MDEYDKVARRAHWLSKNIFSDREIDQDAIAAMAGMGFARAMELFKEIEEKAAEIRNPSQFLKSAARREGLQPPTNGNGFQQQRGAPATGRLMKRVAWLNDKVFVENPIDDQAIEALASVDLGRAFDLLKEVEAKAAEINHPGKYLKAAVNRSGNATPSGNGNGMFRDTDKISKRVHWMNTNLFRNPIDEEALGALFGLGAPRAMELLKEMESKVERMYNPSKFIKVAAIREGLAPPGGMIEATPQRNPGRANFAKVQKRAQWLNDNIFTVTPIDENAIESAASADLGKAMALFKELEEKADEIKNPSAFLQKALRRDAASFPAGQRNAAPVAAHGVQRNDDWVRIHKRATWLSTNVFLNNPIDDDAIVALAGVGITRAMELFKEVEAKGSELRNPSGYLVKAARGGNGGNGGNGGGRVHKRVSWLNEHVFTANPIDEDASAAIAAIDLGRAFEILKELEGKSGEVNNPSGYVTVAANREGDGSAVKRRRIA